MSVVRGSYVFCTNGYGVGSALLKLIATADGIKTEEVYFLTPSTFMNHHGGVVLVGDYLYGGSGQNAGAPVCLELKTGKVCWKESDLAPGSAAVVYADNYLYFLYDNGLVALIEANPQNFHVKASFKMTSEQGPKWAHPVILDGKLYLRDHDMLFCYDLRAEKKPGVSKPCKPEP